MSELQIAICEGHSHDTTTLAFQSWRDLTIYFHACLASPGTKMSIGFANSSAGCTAIIVGDYLNPIIGKGHCVEEAFNCLSHVILSGSAQLRLRLIRIPHSNLEALKVDLARPKLNLNKRLKLNSAQWIDIEPLMFKARDYYLGNKAEAKVEVEKFIYKLLFAVSGHNPALKIRYESGGSRTILVKVSSRPASLLIGRGGKSAVVMRNLIYAVSARFGLRYHLDLIA